MARSYRARRACGKAARGLLRKLLIQRLFDSDYAAGEGKRSMLETALYVSRSTLEPLVAQDVVAKIVADSIRRNTRDSVTGGLIFTGRYFAQVIEGPSAAIESLLARMARDPRHEAMRILHRKPIASRFFFEWAMAYNGPSRMVEGRIAPLVEDRVTGLDMPFATQALALLLKEFALVRGLT
jgi:hypothetical protein